MIPNPHHLSDPQAVRRGDAVFMVTDHFDTARDPSGAPIWYNRNVLALDRSGRVVFEMPFFPHPTGDGKTEQLGHLPNTALAKVASFRLLARPYQWAEFRDVQLQPNAHITALRRTVQSDPSNAKVQYQLAQAFYHSSDNHFRTPRRNSDVMVVPPPAVLAKAIQHLRKAVALESGNVDWQSTLGTYLDNQGHYAEAVPFYKRALQLLESPSTENPPHSIPAVLGEKEQQVFSNQWLLGHALLKMGRYQESAVHYQEALRSYPKAAWLLLGYGDALAGEGKQAEARAAWKKIADVNGYYGRQARARLAGKR